MNIINDEINEFFNNRLYKKFSGLEFGELTVLNLIIQKVKQCHDKFEKQNKKKQEKLNNIYKSIAFFKKKSLNVCHHFTMYRTL